MFLLDSKDNVYWLNVGEGKFTIVADNIEHFKTKLNQLEFVEEWFLPDLVEELKTKKGLLKQGKLYGYIKLPAIGGEFEGDNFEQTDIEVHFGLSAQIHEQIKVLPEGTVITSYSIHYTKLYDYFKWSITKYSRGIFGQN